MTCYKAWLFQDLIFISVLQTLISVAYVQWLSSALVLKSDVWRWTTQLALGMLMDESEEVFFVKLSFLVHELTDFGDLLLYWVDGWGHQERTFQKLN